jgi:hypothetical protein
MGDLRRLERPRCFVERHFAHRSAALAPTHNPEFESAKLSQTVGDFIVQRMHEWGVRRISLCTHRITNGNPKRSRRAPPQRRIL